MFDRIPSPQEIAMAEQRFQMGYASCDDVEVLSWAHPERRYADCGCGDFFAIFDPPWPF
jgi:hypothetical protein